MLQRAYPSDVLEANVESHDSIKPYLLLTGSVEHSPSGSEPAAT